jgi:1,2-diacylglycerol 3-beta-glucosyltransferase
MHPTERLILIALIVGLWVEMLVMAQLTPLVTPGMIIVGIIVGYGMLITGTMLHQKRKAKRLSFQPEPDPEVWPRVSILVPAHNEALVIADTIQNLLDLDYPDFELLIIDDRSTDETLSVVQSVMDQHQDPRLRVLSRRQEAMAGKSAVLNDGLHETHSPLVAVFDADARVAPDFLRRLVPFIIEPTVGAVQARKVIMNDGVNWLTLCQNFEYSMDSYFQCGRDAIRGAVELRGNGQLIKREALQTVSGWNEHTVTDDLDLSTRLHLKGWDVRFAHKVLVFEEGITQFMPLLRQRRRWAEGSLIRYLEFGIPMFTTHTVSLRARADMIAYLVQFLFPIWLVSEYAVLLVDWLLGNPLAVHWVSSVALLPLLASFFNMTLVVAIIRFNRPELIQALVGAALTSIYMVMIWVPVVFWVAVKILFQKDRAMNWGKTAHFGV